MSSSRFPGNVIESLIKKALGALLGLLVGLLVTQGLPAFVGFLGRLLRGLVGLLGVALRVLAAVIHSLVEPFVVLAERMSGRSLRHSTGVTALAVGVVVAFVVVPGIVLALVIMGALIEFIGVLVFQEAPTLLMVVGTSFVVGTVGGLLWSFVSPRLASRPQPSRARRPDVVWTRRSWAGATVRERASELGESEPEHEAHSRDGVLDDLVVGEVRESWW